MQNREIEAKFLEINKDGLIGKLKALGAQDLGEKLLKDMMFYDKAGEWRKSGKTAVRIRQDFDGLKMTYKNLEDETPLGTEEIEFVVGDSDKAVAFLERLGLDLARKQEKIRHKFKMDAVIIDIDTWPSVPTYAEVEGPSEGAIKSVSEKLGFDWSKAIFMSASMTLEKYYKIPIRTIKTFTFEKIE